MGPMAPEPSLARRFAPCRPPRRDWPGAWRALQALLDDPDATENAFRVIRALDPDQDERLLRRVLCLPEGRRLFLERPSLLAKLEDRAGLARLPEGSLGRGYLAHVERWGLDPPKLARLRGETDPRWPELDEGLRWFAERVELIHDLWHVLCGYGASGLGEAALLPFTWAQLGGFGQGLLTLGAALRSRPAWPPGTWPGELWRSWTMGRRAVLLVALPWEDLLARPLDGLRRDLGLRPPTGPVTGLVGAH